MFEDLEAKIRMTKPQEDTIQSSSFPAACEKDAFSGLYNALVMIITNSALKLAISRLVKT